MRRLGIVIVVAALAATGAYLAASAVVYDELSAVTGDCSAAWSQNSPEAFSVIDSDGTPVGGHEGFDTTPYLMPRPTSVTFPSRDPEIMISGWYLPAAKPEARAAIVVHGLSGCKRDYSVLLPAGMLHRNGFAVLLIDLRDHGDSTFEDGRYAGGTEEYRDVLGGWDWLQVAAGLPPERIGLVGISLGAATVLIATGHEPDVAAVWADSSYADLRSAIEDELARENHPTWLAVGGVFVASFISGDDLTSYSPLSPRSTSGGWSDSCAARLAKLAETDAAGPGNAAQRRGSGP